MPQSAEEVLHSDTSRWLVLYHSSPQRREQEIPNNHVVSSRTKDPTLSHDYDELLWAKADAHLGSGNLKNQVADVLEWASRVNIALQLSKKKSQLLIRVVWALGDSTANCETLAKEKALKAG